MRIAVERATTGREIGPRRFCVRGRLRYSGPQDRRTPAGDLRLAWSQTDRRYAERFVAASDCVEAEIHGREIIRQVPDAAEEIGRYEYGHVERLGQRLQSRRRVHDVAEVRDLVAL